MMVSTSLDPVGGLSPSVDAGADQAPIRLLVVDDNALILSSLKRSLRRQLPDWSCTFVLGGAEAITALRARRFDALLTDFDMPEVGGRQVLETAQELDPGMPRVVMTGAQEVEKIVSMAPLAHRVIAKPCPPEDIGHSLQRVVSLQRQVHSEVLRATIGGLIALPAQPRITLELTQLLDDPGVSIREVARLIERSPAISAKVLQIVNSGFFSSVRPITGIQQAATILWTSAIQAVVLSAELTQAFGAQGMGARRTERYQRRSVMVATLAAGIIPDPERRQSAYAAGLLADVGDLLLWSKAKADQAAVSRVARKSGRDRWEVETQHYGICHAGIGAWMLGLWGLPDAVVDAVAHHHRPWCSDEHQRMGVVSATGIASRLIQATEHGEDPRVGLDPTWLNHVAPPERWPDWMSQAEALSAT